MGKQSAKEPGKLGGPPFGTGVASQPRRTHGMTRPWFLIVLVGVLAATLIVMLGAGSFSTWLAWSLGGGVVGAAFLTFDATRNGG